MYHERLSATIAKTTGGVSGPKMPLAYEISYLKDSYT